MGETSIEWCDKVWNPVTGCTKVSQGCKNCYAERIFKRPYPGREFTDVKCHPERLDQPIHWRKPCRIFVNSMSDLFHEKVPDKFLHQIFATMRIANHHTFQVLTKRSERMRSFVWQYERVSKLVNIWFCVSVEDQPTADERIPILLETPAAVRGISAEPLLAPINISEYLPALDWVIVGGESGPRARPMAAHWAQLIRRQCTTAGVPFFFKQGSQANWPDYSNFDSFPDDLKIREYPA